MSIPHSSWSLDGSGVLWALFTGSGGSSGVPLASSTEFQTAFVRFFLGLMAAPLCYYYLLFPSNGSFASPCGSLDSSCVSKASFRVSQGGYGMPISPSSWSNGSFRVYAPLPIDLLEALVFH